MPSEFLEHLLELPASAAGLRLDQALAAALPQYSRARIQAWIKEGAVDVDGRAPRSRDPVGGGEKVRVAARFQSDLSVAPEAMPLRILHEDQDLIVIDKPAGLVVHPGAGNPSHTLQNALLAHDPELARLPRAGIVHRIDKETSGLLVVARSSIAHVALVEALRVHAVQREYLGICVGRVSSGGSVDQPIGRHRTQRTSMTVRADGREARTHYRIEQRYRTHTLLRIQLETGRTHQIRVHLAHIGFPLVGDPVYGGRRQLTAGSSPELLATLKTFRRQALHAAQLELVHPVSGIELRFTAPLPEDFAALKRALQVDAEGP
ncbi:MAG: 23S rRNA pseudouridine(1911/1915/1917) synthase RluD [Steroidobacteraceae bacterium]